MAAIGPPSITYNRKDVLDKGKYGVNFRGLLDGHEVAVRRVLQEYVQTVSNEAEVLQLSHPNIVKILKIEITEEFRLYAFDLAVGTLDDVCRGKYSGPMPDDKEAILQMAKGLEYIHSKRMIHCNLNPHNIHVSNDLPNRLMIVVFGCCKQKGESLSTYWVKEAEGWMAPEIIEYHQVRDDDDGDDNNIEDNSGGELHTVSSDIWTLGCLLFYFLTRGKHPFGNNSSDIKWNMLVTRKPVEIENFEQSGGIEHYANVIKSMIKVKPTERQELDRVIMYLEEVWRYVDAATQGVHEAASHLQGIHLSPRQSADIDQPAEIWRSQSGGDSSDRQEIRYAQIGGASPDHHIIAVAQAGGSVRRNGRSSSDHQDGPRSSVRVIRTPLCQNSCPAPGEFWIGRSPDQREERLQWNDEWLYRKVQELEDKLKLTSDELLKKIKNSNEKIGHLNETAIRKKVTTDATKKSLEYREIKSLSQLVQCYSEAKGIRSSDQDNNKMCLSLVNYLKDKKSKKNFCQWYYEEAIKHVMQKTIKDEISEHPLRNRADRISVTAVYKKSKFLRNYIDGNMTANDWNNFSGTSSPIFLLALFESLKDRKDLMSFPPPGIITMDIPVKISSAKNSVHIEIGEIKSSDSDEVIHKARTQLKRSLLCFQWLDKIMETPQSEHYGLIGNIYFDGNRQSNAENSEYYEDEFTFKLKYETYT